MSLKHMKLHAEAHKFPFIKHEKMDREIKQHKHSVSAR